MARLIAEKFKQWEAQCNARFCQLKENEEQLNRIFIDIYGLQEELTPQVADTAVTVRKANLQREIKSLISYAVGCIFGRYSPDTEGICYDGGIWDASRYQTVLPVEDNILLICEGTGFENDLLGRVVNFVESVYGKETLEENLQFIACGLGGQGSAREVLRHYLLTGFYADHLKTYRKRPIYWLFSSGKKNSFRALCYLHRYQPDLLDRMHRVYVPSLEAHYRSKTAQLAEAATTATPAQKVLLQKKIHRLQEQTLELGQFEKKLHSLADQRISIDLDHGVKVNYAKFRDILEPIKW